ncbi:hypothetical protein BDV39DRAFT_218807 [Aspergillus sergii]|uniref:NAD(P)-binding protein n=1 Tax=Aspergillus sergii TaxID=1034303 RepID=A0A5N6XE63_9EURO|nr:hypothetical protein BDV39DRAFT_218807 [Aspergillus sergii]
MATSTSISAASLFDVSGIVVIVTGGGSDLGLFMTKALAANGAKKNQDTVIRIQCDATDQSALKAAVAHIEAETGYINLLIANSGSVPPGSSITELQETLYNIPMQDFTNTFHVNCTAVFYTTVAFLGLLAAGNRNGSYANRCSQVIATSSIGSFNRCISAGFSYSTSKAATTIMMKVLATYLVLYRIRANVLCPRLFPTDLTTGLYKGKNPIEGAFPRDQIPAERAGTPEDIMGPLLYLASCAGAYCNGNCVLTDGGWLSVTPCYLLDYYISLWWYNRKPRVW